MLNKPVLILVSTSLLALVACSGTQQSESIKEQERGPEIAISEELEDTHPAETPLLTPTKTLSPTATPEPTNTPQPSNTPEPTETPTPTNTLVPTSTSTPTPIPAPIILSGSGDSNVEVDKFFGPAIVHITSSGSISVRNYTADDQLLGLIVNSLKSYEGNLPIDFDDRQTARFDITTGGAWTIEILSLTEADSLEVPGEFQGRGDNVIVLTGETPNVATISDTSGAGFLVYGWDGKASEKLVQAVIDPITNAEVVVSPGTIMLIIYAHPTDNWTIIMDGK